MTEEWRDLLSLIPGYDSEATAGEGDYFDADAAELAVSFVPECLRFIEGEKAGEPFRLEPWQRAIIAALFGWKRADGTRRYRECLLYVPRKNGKTPLAAAIILLLAFVAPFREPGGQLYSAACNREQASLIFRHVAGMIEREPWLARDAKIYRSYKSVELPENAVYKALAASAASLHGLGPNVVIVDELHAHRGAELVETLITGTAARREPLVIHTTTADYDRKSVCNDKYAYACGVRDGTLEDSSFLPVIYEAAQDDDWTDPEVWARANPNLGVSVNREYLERECRRAQAEPSYENAFRRLHLNQQTSQEHRWLSLSDWDACGTDLPDLTGRPCYAGLDLASTSDTTALVLCYPPQDPDEPTYLVPFFWVPEAKLQGSGDRVPYAAWARDGHLETTPGNVTDYDFIRARINELGERYSIREIRYDPWNAQHLATLLSEHDGFTLTEMRQGYRSMSAPTKELERRVMGGTLGHDGHPVLRWQMGNATIRRDPADNIKVDKAKSRERVDGVVAAVMALSGVMAGPEPESIYASRGIITL